MCVFAESRESFCFKIFKVKTIKSCYFSYAWVKVVKKWSKALGPRGLFWTSVRSVALEKEQWQTWGL